MTKILEPNRYPNEAEFLQALSGGSSLTDVITALHALQMPTVVCDTTEIDAMIATAQGVTIVQPLHLAGTPSISSLFCENNSSVSVGLYGGLSQSGRFLAVIPPYSYKAFPLPDYISTITAAIPPGSAGLIRITGSTAPERSVGEGFTTTGTPQNYSGNIPTGVAQLDAAITVVPPNKMLVVTDIFVSSTVTTSVRFQIQAGVGGATVFDGYLQPNSTFQLSALQNVPAIPFGTVLNFRTFADASGPHAVSYTILGQLR